MGRLSSKLWRNARGFAHWCPGCNEIHVVPDSWSFDGNLEQPTFFPSVKHTGKQTVKDAEGRWTGEWVKGPDGKALDDCCHYNLRDGQLHFCSDSVHHLKNQTVPLPDLPNFLRDDDFN